MLFSEPKIPQCCRELRERALQVPFQCSSASRKFLNSKFFDATGSFIGMGFSALQRAENSSISNARARAAGRASFQCSSASRKFLNSVRPACRRRNKEVSVLFSEPKIPQSFTRSSLTPHRQRVSVLFSEPKIPQSKDATQMMIKLGCFSALQRAENSSILPTNPQRCAVPSVSVLFSEPKIPQS